jgi:hypothetical protein
MLLLFSYLLAVERIHFADLKRNDSSSGEVCSNDR